MSRSRQRSNFESECGQLLSSGSSRNYIGAEGCSRAMRRKSRHVVPAPGGGWSVRQSGASRASRVFADEAEAVRFGREAAQKDRTELYVHRQDGTIRRKLSYDFNPPHPKRER